MAGTYFYFGFFFFLIFGYSILTRSSTGLGGGRGVVDHPLASLVRSERPEPVEIK